MKSEYRAGILTAVLIMAVAVLFSGVLDRPQNVIPLVLVPALLFAGYAVASAGFRTWAAMTVAITLLLVLLYALP